MAPPTPRLVVPIDLKKKPWEQKLQLHNRWHPEIPSVAEVTTGEVFRVEMVDWTGGAIKDDDSANDVKFIDLSTVHYLSGPIRVVDKDGVPAKPGDLLAVEICNLGALPGDEWGYTATFDRGNGGGFLTDHFPSATKAIWYFEGIYAYSPHIPGKFLFFCAYKDEYFPNLPRKSNNVISRFNEYKPIFIPCQCCHLFLSNAIQTTSIVMANFPCSRAYKDEHFPIVPRKSNYVLSRK